MKRRRFTTNLKAHFKNLYEQFGVKLVPIASQAGSDHSDLPIPFRFLVCKKSTKLCAIINNKTSKVEHREVKQAKNQKIN